MIQLLNSDSPDRSKNHFLSSLQYEVELTELFNSVFEPCGGNLDKLLIGFASHITALLLSFVPTKNDGSNPLIEAMPHKTIPMTP